MIVVGIAWMGLKFLTRNVRTFLDLRFEIRRQLQRFALDEPRRSGDQPVSPGGERSPGGDPPDGPSPEHGPEVFRQLGFQMLLFAHSARIGVWVVKMMGYDPIKAGDNLISLSHDTGLAFRRKSIADALRFDDGGPADGH